MQPIRRLKKCPVKMNWQYEAPQIEILKINVEAEFAE